jgi:hypothetical protein
MTTTSERRNAMRDNTPMEALRDRAELAYDNLDIDDLDITGEFILYLYEQARFATKQLYLAARARSGS